DPGDFGARLAEWFRRQDDKSEWRYPGTACLEAAGRLAEGIAPEHSGVDGAGCGAAMRVAPVGVALRHSLLLPDVADAQSRLTHRNDVAVDGARAVAVAVGRLCADGPGRDGGVSVVLASHEVFFARAEVGLRRDDAVARRGRP